MSTTTVLVAEDNPELRKLLCATLAHHGYRTLQAEDGRAVLEVARSHHPDLILMDLAMPFLSGIDAAQRLHGDPELERIPILAVTGNTSFAAEARELSASGIAEVLEKPFAAGELLAAVRRTLPGRRG